MRDIIMYFFILNNLWLKKIIDNLKMWELKSAMSNFPTDFLTKDFSRAYLVSVYTLPLQQNGKLAKWHVDKSQVDYCNLLSLVCKWV
jgi:hypothetical protein